MTRMHATDVESPSRTVCFDTNRVTIRDIVSLAEGSARARLSDEPSFRAVISRGADFLERRLREEGTVYGVTTGFGDSCTVTVAPELVAGTAASSLHLSWVRIGKTLQPDGDPGHNRLAPGILMQGLLGRQHGVAGATDRPAAGTIYYRLFPAKDPWAPAAI